MVQQNKFWCSTCHVYVPGTFTNCPQCGRTKNPGLLSDINSDEPSQLTKCNVDGCTEGGHIRCSYCRELFCESHIMEKEPDERLCWECDKLSDGGGQ